MNLTDLIVRAAIDCVDRQMFNDARVLAVFPRHSRFHQLCRLRFAAMNLPGHE